MTLWTIGYQGQTIESFIATLQDSNITLLVDVRSKPYSRNVAFNKSYLQPALEKAGIEYAWEGLCLGGLSGHRENCYETRLAWLLDQTKTRRIAVMCMERCWQDCHRGQWITADAEKQGFKVIHLPHLKVDDDLKQKKLC